MGLKNIIGKAGGLKNIRQNPAGAAGTLVGGAVAAAGHPYIAAAVAKGTEKVVNKGIELAHDPEVQAKAREIGNETVTRGRAAIQGLASRAGELSHGLGK